MKQIIFIILAGLSLLAGAQTSPTPEQIRQQMAKIRQTTNWDDPAAAKKANDEIKKLAARLSGGKTVVSGTGQQQATGSSKQATIIVRSSEVTKDRIVAIADRFYNRSYNALDAVSKNQFNLDLKAANNDEFSLEAVRNLTTTGGVNLTFGSDHHFACVYLAAAVRAFPDDTLSVNNFGAYLRNIDSVSVSIPVLLYANQLFSQSPLILTQLANSYFELNDFTKAESYYKEALKINPDFSQAHTSLCDLYIKQNRLQDAILELFAGVKGMACSYNQLSDNFSNLKSQAENSPGGESEKEKFWNETRSQMNPPDALAPLERSVERIKMPAFGNCLMLADWIEGGGYASAVQAYGRFRTTLSEFAEEFQRIQKEKPNIPQNAVLRDYPNERFALDCITEYFFRESQKEYDDFKDKVDDIMSEVNDESELYFKNKERYTKDYVKESEKCNFEPYCLNECKRIFCTQDCPATDNLNKKLQSYWEQYLKTFRETADNQKKILEDMYEFTAQWYSKLESPYWSRIYAYEIQRIALVIVGNAYSAYEMPFPGPVYSDCGQDCSVYANPYPIPPEEVKKPKPDAMPCPDLLKGKFGLGVCEIGVDCESIEFGCTAGGAISIKRNFVKKTTTAFLGAGFKGSAGFIGAGFKGGMEVTVTDNNEVSDAGFKFDVSVSGGAKPASAGYNKSGSFTIMSGFKSKGGFSVGGKAE